MIQVGIKLFFIQMYDNVSKKTGIPDTNAYDDLRTLNLSQQIEEGRQK
jgi:hypothetical protein